MHGDSIHTKRKEGSMSCVTGQNDPISDHGIYPPHLLKAKIIVQETQDQPTIYG